MYFVEDGNVRITAHSTVSILHYLNFNARHATIIVMEENLDVLCPVINSY